MTERNEEAGNALAPQAAEDVETVAAGGAVQVAGQITARSLSFFFTAIAARILEAAGYGLYRKVVQVLAIAAQMGLAGFNFAAMRYIARARARDEHAGVRGNARIGLAGSGIASAVAFTAIVLGADALAEIFRGGPGVARLFRIGAPYVPLFALMQVLRYCTQAYRTMVPSVVVGNIIQPVARFVFGAAALLAGFAVVGAVGSLVLATGVGTVAAAWYYRRILTAEERAATPSARVGPMLRFALPQAGASLFSIQDLGLGVILLGMLSSNREVGLFAAALALQGPGNVFLSGIVNIWAPVVSDLHSRGDIARLESLYQTITRWIATFSFPVFAALILEGDLFIRLFADFRAERAGVIVAILAAGNAFYTGTGPTGYLLSMTGRPGINFANSIVAVGLYVALGAWLVPAQGAVGMALVDACVTALVNAARVLEAKLLVGIQPFGRSFLKPVVATLVGAAALLAWRLVPGEHVALEVLGVALAAAVYLAVLRAFGVDPEERYVLDLIKARVRSARRNRRRK